MIFRSTAKIVLEDLSPERLDRYDIKLVAGIEYGRVYSYLYSPIATLRACPDENGYVDFAVLENASFPFSTFDALRHEFNCDLERIIDDRSQIVTPLGEDEKARIGRELVKQNRHLSQEPQVLLRLVTDIYEPPTI